MYMIDKLRMWMLEGDFAFLSSIAKEEDLVCCKNIGIALLIHNIGSCGANSFEVLIVKGSVNLHTSGIDQRGKECIGVNLFLHHGSHDAWCGQGNKWYSKSITKPFGFRNTNT